MAKFINKRIEVSCDTKNIPSAFRFNGKLRVVTKVLEIWKDTGCWWNGEAEKMFYRAEADGNGLYEFFLDIEHQVWYLYKTYD